MKIYLKYIFLFLIAGSIFSSCNQKMRRCILFGHFKIGRRENICMKTTANVNSAVKSKAISLCGNSGC